MDREIEIKERLGRGVRRWVKIALAALVVLVPLLLLPRWMRPSLDRSEIRTARVERGTVEEVVTASGIVVPASEKVLSSPVEARVLSILERPGAILDAGDEIVRLDTSALALELERLEERLAQTINRKQQLELDLETRLVELESQVERKRLDVEILGHRQRQYRTLFEEGLVSEETQRQTEVEAKKAEIELSQLEEAIEVQRRSNANQVESLQLEVEVLTKERDEGRRQVQLATIRADRGGVLTWVVPEEGVTVQKGDVVARVADLGSFRVESTVSDIHASRLEDGAEVQVLLDGDKLPARISRIYPTIEEGVVRFESELADPSDPRLRNDLRADVLVVTGRRQATLRVRKGPFLRGQGAEQPVFMVEGDRAVRQEVTFGLSGNEYVEVVDGLTEGEEIIISATPDLLHAEEIRLH